MSFVKVAIHAVWGTKNHFPFLTEEIRKTICDHIKENALKKNIYIDCIDGYTDHLHCMFYLNHDMTLEKAMQLIKGESSYWINRQLNNIKNFGWADDYYAVSVSESGIENVRAYIKNQSEHHKKITYQEECKKFLEYIGRNKIQLDKPD